jgi:hypothetical protein
MHGGVVHQPPATYLELPLYHVNLLQIDLERR